MQFESQLLVFSKHVHKPLAVSDTGSSAREGSELVERGWEMWEPPGRAQEKRPLGHTPSPPLTHFGPDCINICMMGNDGTTSSLSGLVLFAWVFSLVTPSETPSSTTLRLQGGISPFHSVTFSSAIHLAHFITDIKSVCYTYSRCFLPSLLGGGGPQHKSWFCVDW